MRQAHARRAIACLRAGVRELTIAKFDLDSPSISDVEFARELDWAVERHTRRANLFTTQRRIRKAKRDAKSATPATPAPAVMDVL